MIGRACKNVSEADALSYVLGDIPANDVTARSQQFDKDKSGGQFCRNMSFDTFCPLEPILTLASAVPDPQALKIQTRHNGELVQDGHTSPMLFSVRRIVSFLSESTTLLPGTVLLTGTPSAVGFNRSRRCGGKRETRWRLP